MKPIKFEQGKTYLIRRGGIFEVVSIIVDGGSRYKVWFKNEPAPEYVWAKYFCERYKIVEEVENKWDNVDLMELRREDFVKGCEENLSWVDQENKKAKDQMITESQNATFNADPPKENMWIRRKRVWRELSEKLSSIQNNNQGNIVDMSKAKVVEIKTIPDFNSYLFLFRNGCKEHFYIDENGKFCFPFGEHPYTYDLIKYFRNL